MTKLRISDDLSLPRDAVTQTFVILSKRGSGKTYLASVMGEEMLKRGLHIAVLDPTGAWWGLRSSADGKADGYPVIVLGGEHGDVPLEATSGAVIADFVIDSGQSVVLDLQLFRKAEQKRFALDFSERLFHRNREPIHIFIDESDEFAPQRPFKGDERLLGSIEDLVRRGRKSGIGVTLISQRSAVLNKNVLSQAEVLVALRTTAPQDKKAIDAWIEENGTDEERQVLMESLAKLPIGTAWFWSPGWLEVFKKVQVRRRETFNSSATPKVGERRIVPTKRAEVDLEALKTKIAAAIEKAKAEDPKELRAQLAAARKENAVLHERISENHRELEKAMNIKTVSKGSFEDAVDKAVARQKPLLTETQIKRLEVVAGKVEFASAELAERMKTASETIFAFMRNVLKQQEVPAAVVDARAAIDAMTKSSNVHQSIAHTRRFKTSLVPMKPPAVSDPKALTTNLKAGAYKMLQMLAQRHPLKLTRAQLGTMAGFTPSGGTFQSYFSTLKRASLITEASNGDVEITPDGLARVGSDVPPAPQTTEELLAMWRKNLKKGAADMLDALVTAYPNGIDRLNLGGMTGFTHTGGTFQSYLSTLRRNGLVEVEGEMVKASSSLFLEG